MNEASARLVVRVQPNAARSQVVRFEDGVLHVRIAAPPVKGRANRELVDFLSRVLGVPKSTISIERGLTSRRKTVIVAGMSEQDVSQHLEKR